MADRKTVPARRRFFWPAVVLITCGLALSVIMTCHVMAKQRGHVPPWLWSPAISFTGNQAPERYVYSGGFAVVAVLFLVMARSYYGTTLQWLERKNKPQLDRALLVAVAAFMLLFAQAAIPLQEDMVDYLLPSDDAAGPIAALTATSILHQCCAIAFFGTAVLHAAMMLRLYATDARLPTGARSALALEHNGVLWWRLKCACFACIPLPALLWPFLHPGTAGVSTSHQGPLILGGLIQYSAVGSVIAYFATYARDFYVLDALQYASHANVMSED